MVFAEDLPPFASDDFAPLAARWQPQGPGPCGSADPLSRKRRREQAGLPGSWGTPRCPRRLLKTPAGPPSQASKREQARPPLARTAGAPTTRPISGLNGPARDTRCLRFARGLPHQDARLASGCWPDSTGWAQRPNGFLRKVSSMLLTSLSSFPRLLLAQARGGPIPRGRCDRS
jgi:hypothetical protein